MSRMTIQKKREFLLELYKIGDIIKIDEHITKEVLQAHLKYLPNKKLYKFRACNERNFQMLRENSIWMSSAAEFNDPFDNTININLKKNSGEIKRWLYEKYPDIIFKLLQQYYESRGVSWSYTQQDIHDYMKTCLEDDDVVIEEVDKKFIIAHTDPENVDAVLKECKLLSDQSEMNQIIDCCVQILIDLLNELRSSIRNTTLVYCMTEQYDNQTLWENYADKYRGFCVEYSFKNFDKQSFDDYKNLIYMFPVTYQSRIPIFDIVPLVDQALNSCIEEDEKKSDVSELYADLNLQLFYKKKEYEYEHEWRFSIKDMDNNKQRFPFVNAIYAGKDIEVNDLDELKCIADSLSVPIYRQTINKSCNEFDYQLM